MRVRLWALAAFFYSLQLVAQGPSKEGPSALSKDFYQAETYRITGRVQLAMDAYAKLLAGDPSHEAALYQLARLQFEQGYLMEAFTTSQRGALAHPENEWMLRLFAQVARQMGDLKTAGKTFETLHTLAPQRPEYLYDALDAYLQLGAAQDALKVLLQIESELGGSPELVQYKAEQYLKMNDAKGAERMYKAALTDHPQVPEYYGLLSQYYDGNGKTKKAVKLLKAAVEKFPENGAIHMELARLAQKLGERELSLLEMEKGLVLDGVALNDKIPVVLSLYQNKSLPEFDALLSRVLPVMEEKYSGKLEYYLLIGQIFLEEGRTLEALEAYTAAINLDPENYDLYQITYSIAKEVGDLNSQSTLLSLIEQNFSNSPTIMEGLVYEYYNRALWEPCARLAEDQAALRLDPAERANLYDITAISYFKLKEPEKGAKFFEYSLDINRDAETLNNYAWELALSEQNLDYALALTTESNELMHLEPNLLDTWAWVLYKMNRYEEAQAKISVALQLLRTKPDPVVYRHAAAIAEALGDAELVQEYRAKAKELEQ
jgi:tetratricopeptide (TPR) repeat protein